MVRALTAGGAEVVESSGPLDTPILPGSLLKVVTIAAALESGVLRPTTGILCTRTVDVDGRPIRCTHPDLHRPLRPADALAHSCNGFAATVARRLSRAAFDRTLVELGLPPSDPAVPLAQAALGLNGVRASPRRLLDMMIRIDDAPSSLPWQAATWQTVRDGLLQATRHGTAAVFADHGLDARAKTGTVVVGGAAQGAVAGVVTLPSSGTRAAASHRLAFVRVAAGVSGADAASLAASRLAVIAAKRRHAAAPAARIDSSSSGTIRVGIPDAAGRYAVRTMPLEDYVAGVVAGEAAPGATTAALEALAITVRSFALANRSRHRDDGFDLCSLTHCQVLRGSTRQTTSAAGATAGQVLLNGAAVAPVFFSAACGGRTARPSDVWVGARDVAFLPSRADDACAHHPPWRVELRVGELLRAFRMAGWHGERLHGLRVLTRTPSGRVARVELDGIVPRTVSGDDLRTAVGRSLGWNTIRSHAFDIERTPAGFRLTGRGAGHGVGLCIVGSATRAARGETVENILAHYFPGLRIGQVPLRQESGTRTDIASGPIVVTTPLEDRPSKPALQELATRLRAALIEELGMSRSPSMRLHFHPTVESYQRATGRQWFTSGATDETGVAHFIPLTVLQARGILERTLRHELVHLLTDGELRDRPLWIREGAAIYFSTPADERQEEVAARDLGSSVAAPSCPSDAELLRPSSRDVLRRAYARAADCFARTLTRSGAWRDVR